MKAKDLITKLKKLDPETIVETPSLEPVTHLRISGEKVVILNQSETDLTEIKRLVKIGVLNPVIFV